MKHLLIRPIEDKLLPCNMFRVGILVPRHGSQESDGGLGGKSLGDGRDGGIFDFPNKINRIS